MRADKTNCMNSNSQKRTFFDSYLDESVFGLPEGYSLEDIKKVMNPEYPDYTDQEFYSFFDRTIKSTIVHLSQLVDNWDDLSLSEIRFDTLSCISKITRVCLLFDEYQLRLFASFYLERRLENHNYYDTLVSLRRKYSQKFLKLGAVYTDKDRKKLKALIKRDYEINLIALPRIAEVSIVMGVMMRDMGMLPNHEAYQLKSIARKLELGWNLDVAKETSRDIRHEDIEPYLKKIQEISEKQYGMDAQMYNKIEIVTWVQHLEQLFFYLEVIQHNKHTLKLSFESKKNLFQDSRVCKNAIKEAVNQLLFKLNEKEVSPEIAKQAIQEIKTGMTKPIELLYIKNYNDNNKFIDELLGQGFGIKELEDLLSKLCLLDYYQSIIDGSKKPNANDKEHGSVPTYDISNLPDEQRHLFMKPDKFDAYCRVLKGDIKTFIEGQGNKALWDVVNFYSKLYGFFHTNISRKNVAAIFVAIIPELGEAKTLTASMGKCDITDKKKLKNYATLPATDGLKAYEENIGKWIKEIAQSEESSQ